MKRPCFYCLSMDYENDINMLTCKKCGISYTESFIKEVNFFKWMYISIFRVFSVDGKYQDFENNRYIPLLTFHTIGIYKFNIIVWKWLYNLITKITQNHVE